MRLTFLSHFVICLAVAAAAFFAWINGVFQVVYHNDLSMMTSVIAVVFVGTSLWLGWLAWTLEDRRYVDAAWGHLAERLLPMMGLFGTAFGLSLQAKALSGGTAAFEPLATSLYCTAAGVLSAAIVAVMTYNIERSRD